MGMMVVYGDGSFECDTPESAREVGAARVSAYCCSLRVMRAVRDVANGVSLRSQPLLCVSLTRPNLWEPWSK